MQRQCREFSFEAQQQHKQHIQVDNYHSGIRLFKVFSAVKTIPLKGGSLRIKYRVPHIPNKSLTEGKRSSWWGEKAWNPLTAESMSEEGAMNLLRGIAEQARIDLKICWRRMMQPGTISPSFKVKKRNALKKALEDYKANVCKIKLPCTDRNCKRLSECEVRNNYFNFLSSAEYRDVTDAKLYEIAELFGQDKVSELFRSWCDAKYGCEYDEDGIEYGGYIKCYDCTVPTEYCKVNRQLRPTGRKRKQ